MALKAKLDTLDGLPEAIAKEYKKVEEGDKVHYVLDAEGIEDVSGLKSALGKERTARASRDKVLKKLGIKPEDEEAVNTLLESLGEDTLEEALAKAKSAAASADEGTKAMAQAKKLVKQLEEAQENLSSRDNFIDKLLRQNAISAALATVEGNVVMMMPHLLGHTKTVEEDGADGKEFVVKVIDPKSKEVRMKGSKEMTVPELVEEFAAKEEFAGAFPGTGASGSGARPQNRTTTVSGSEAGPRNRPDAVEAKRASGTYAGI